MSEYRPAVAPAYFRIAIIRIAINGQNRKWEMENDIWEMTHPPPGVFPYHPLPLDANILIQL